MTTIEAIGVFVFIASTICLILFVLFLAFYYEPESEQVVNEIKEDNKNEH